MKKDRTTSALLENMLKTFTNAKADKFQTKLAPNGFDIAGLDKLLADLEEVKALIRDKESKYSIQIELTAEIEKSQEELNDVYKGYLNFAKTLFADDKKAINDLELTGARKKIFNEWIEQVDDFYATILENKDYLDKFVTINVTKETIQSCLDNIKALENKKAEQAKAMGEAQKATETKDIALDALSDKYSELIKLARIFFKDDQDLEALGILVRR